MVMVILVMVVMTVLVIVILMVVIPEEGIVGGGMMEGMSSSGARSLMPGEKCFQWIPAPSPSPITITITITNHYHHHHHHHHHHHMNNFHHLKPRSCCKEINWKWLETPETETVELSSLRLWIGVEIRLDCEIVDA